MFVIYIYIIYNIMVHHVHIMYRKIDVFFQDMRSMNYISHNMSEWNEWILTPKNSKHLL